MANLELGIPVHVISRNIKRLLEPDVYHFVGAGSIIIRQTIKSANISLEYTCALINEDGLRIILEHIS